MALLEAKDVVVSTSNTTTTTSVFDRGIYETRSFTVETSTTGTPKPLFIVTPTTKGTYPVILFLHGFYLRNTFYSQLLLHISSHGYIVVAPQVLLYVYSFSFLFGSKSYICIYTYSTYICMYMIIWIDVVVPVYHTKPK